jgi:putative Holliday junction resolvase
MNILSIDFGLSKVGIALSTSLLAEPYSVIKYEKIEDLFKKIKEICQKEEIQKIVIGISEGEMGEKTREFKNSLEKEIEIPIELFDETLSTFDAQNLSIESGMRRSKRKNMEDAIAAAVLLQNYIDLN